MFFSKNLFSFVSSLVKYFLVRLFPYGLLVSIIVKFIHSHHFEIPDLGLALTLKVPKYLIFRHF